MKKILIFSLVLGVTLLAGGIVVAAGTEKAGDENSRYLVKSNSGVLKMIYGVNHKFDSGFTTDLTQRQLKFLDKFGVEVEPVVMYHIVGKPVCGDKTIHPSEQCGEPGLECSTGYVCENCKCVEETAPEPEHCTPTKQYPWGITKVNGGSGGAGIKVAVLDTGVYKDHLDLKDRIIDCRDTTMRGIKKSCVDGNGHGTHVAGTILADAGSVGQGIYGVAPEAELMAIKVLDNQGSGWADDIAAGIIYAAHKGANIISMSLGGEYSSLINSAVDYANENDVLVIAAAGNHHPIYNPENVIQYPAANPKVIAVAAFDSLNVMAEWSSIGVNNNNWIIEEREIEFAAPGIAVESTWNDGCYEEISGTSMAAPHIAGIAARDWKGSASATRIHLQGLAKTYTEDTTNGYDYGEAGDDIKAGFGLPIVLQVSQ